ncbi:UNVERIFIED_CONTAM: hypothetical protein FKN15_019885, partial [Acipenser sinensis]
ALSAVHSKDVFAMKLKSRKNLQSSKSSRQTILVELSCEEDRELQYLPGEHVGVFPGNQASLVSGIIKLLKNTPPSNQNLRLEVCRDSGQGSMKSWSSDTRLPACTLSQTLTYFLDITTPPSQSLLRKLAQLSTQDSERTRLETLAQASICTEYIRITFDEAPASSRLSTQFTGLGCRYEWRKRLDFCIYWISCQDPGEYNTWKSFNSPTLLEVLEEFPSIEASATFLLSQLPPLKPRFYSISSSLDHSPRQIHLTVAVVNYTTRDGLGPVHHGVCSTWLNTIKEGDVVPCFIRRASGFHLPKDPSLPSILVGPGTGIAPFRSFWQQRLHDLEQNGVAGAGMTLVFGCRQSDTDHLYQAETLQLKRKGVLKDVYTAYSREPGQPKVYVQDVLRDRLAGEVYRVLHEDGGHIYICGDVRMARDVSHTLKELFADRLGLNLEQAGDYLTQLKVSGEKPQSIEPHRGVDSFFAGNAHYCTVLPNVLSHH